MTEVNQQTGSQPPQLSEKKASDLGRKELGLPVGPPANARARFLAWKDSTFHGTAKAVHHN